MKGELVIDILVLAMTIFLLRTTQTFKQISKYDVMGPGFWPRIVLISLLVLTTFLLIRNITQWRTRRGQEPAEEKDLSVQKLILSLVVAFAYFFIMKFTGFILGTLVFQGLFLFVQGVRKIKVLIGTPLFLTTILFILFIKIMYLPLPRGMGIFRTFSLLFY